MYPTIPAPLSRNPSRTKPIASALAFVALGLALAAPAEAIKRRAFATSATGSGNLSSWADAGGAAGRVAANNVCQARAADAGLSNPGSFRAWLSDGATDAYCNVQGITGTKSSDCNGQSLPIQGPWFLPNDAAFAAALPDLTEFRPPIYRPILVDENGVFLDGVQVLWTGTSGTGQSFGPNCGGWTSAQAAVSGYLGVATGTTGIWTALGSTACDQSARLLCFESLPGESPILPSGTGALAFVSSTLGSGDLASWPGATGEGLSAGDAICRSLATEARLPAPDSFVAWLSDGTVDAADRITTEGPFRRVDGFLIAGSRNDLIDGATQNSLHVDELGQYATGNYRVWTGTDGFGQGTNANCDGWQSEPATGSTGRSSFARSEEWTLAYTSACDTEAHLYCFSNVVTLFWDGFELTGDTSRWSDVMP